MLREWLHEWDLRRLVVCLALLLASCALEANTATTLTDLDEPVAVATTNTADPTTTVTTTAAKATTTTAITTTTSAPTTTISSETTAASMSFPITFAGSGTMTFTTDQMGAAGSCVLDHLLTVTLLRDGEVEGTIEGERLATTIEQVEGVSTLVCLDRDDYVADLIGSHHSGEVELRVADSPDRPFLQGKYEPHQLTIDQEIVSQVTGDVTVTNWALFEFELPPQNG